MTYYLPDSEQDFKHRNTNRIDIAHIKAIEFLVKHEIYYKTMGFDPKEDKVPSELWWKVPTFIRCMPDIFTITDKGFSFLEVKGCRGSLKIKLDDYFQYKLWATYSKMLIFVYSTAKKCNYLFNVSVLDSLIDNAVIMHYKDNGKMFFKIKLNDIEKFAV